MASFLTKQVKKVLLELAGEFDTTGVSEDLTKLKIIEKIQKASDYEEQIAKDFLDVILERLKEEKEERDNEFELEKLRLQAATDNSSVASITSVHEGVAKRSNLRNLVPNFDPKNIDISLFFTIFERQARREGIEEKNWVANLIPLLPPEIMQIIVKIEDPEADDYQHVKKVLFSRFKLSARALKEKFENYQKKPGELWVDMAHDLKGYLSNWLETLEITTFESLKELILTEQLKKRVPGEIKSHFVDVWEDLKEASTLAEKCDKFEAIRRDSKKWEAKPYVVNSFKKNNGFSSQVEKTQKTLKLTAENVEDKSRGNANDLGERKEKLMFRNFDKIRKIYCYNCKKEGHIRPQCPEIVDKKRYPVNNLNLEKVLGEGFGPYIDKAIINGEVRNYLRDTGTVLDVCESDMISVEDLLSENVWVRQPLDSTCRCLPLARITLKLAHGTVVTKAVVKPAEANQGYYLLGNATAKLIEQLKQEIQPLNAVITRK